MRVFEKIAPKKLVPRIFAEAREASVKSALASRALPRSAFVKLEPLRFASEKSA
jgi:hypothetical protein